MKVIHVTPTYFAESSIIGGGERYVDNVCTSLGFQDVIARSDILSFGAEARDIVLRPKSTLRIIKTAPAKSFGEADAYANSQIRKHLAGYDVVHVHQCLTPFGLYVASHARLLEKIVIGTDHGGGETPLYQSHPFLYGNFDFLHAQSKFASSSYADATVPVRVIKGPVDDRRFRTNPAEHRNPRLLISIGRILPHKGFENLIDALPGGCKLIIAGRIHDSEYHEFLKGRVGDKQVVFEPLLDDGDLLALIWQAGLCLHGSVNTGFNGNRYLKAELLGLAPLECMLTGMPAICSQTAALHELGVLRGCRTYREKEDLADLLQRYLSGALNFPPANIIRDDVVEHYGMEQFGRKYVSALGGASSCAF